MDNQVQYSRWLKRSNNIFIPTDNSLVVKTIDSGYYDIRNEAGIGYYLFKKEIVLDELLEFPSSVHEEVIKCVKDFWERKAKFKEYNFAFKRGILLHGLPGNGKTCLINICVKHLVDHLNGVVFHLSNVIEMDYYSKFCPEIFRIIEKDRPLIVIMEDIENMCDGSHESTLLNVLDGLDQMENVIYIATTNYIEKLKERIINRPSRFDRRIYMPALDAVDRMFFFQHKLKENDKKSLDLDTWVKDTEGMSIAHLAELIKSVVIFNNSYEYSIELLKNMNDLKNLNSANYRESEGIGFKH